MGVFLLFTALRVLRQVGFGEPGVPNLRFSDWLRGFAHGFDSPGR
jgi:hypothetical protein